MFHLHAIVFNRCCRRPTRIQVRSLAPAMVLSPRLASPTNIDDQQWLSVELRLCQRCQVKRQSPGTIIGANQNVVLLELCGSIGAQLIQQNDWRGRPWLPKACGMIGSSHDYCQSWHPLWQIPGNTWKPLINSRAVIQPQIPHKPLD